MRSLLALISIAAALLLFQQCKKDPAIVPSVPNPEPVDPGTPCNATYNPTTYKLLVPEGFPPALNSASNPLTVEGIALGKKLFFDPILSGDQTQSCASCHNQTFAFTDNGLQFSEGITGAIGNRNAMALVNMTWNTDFFWDGRSGSLEEQALGPVPNPIEMNLSWPIAEQRLNDHDEYPCMFYEAFGIDTIDSIHVAKAIAQYERILISGNSKFDKWLRGEASLTTDEFAGMDIFITEKGDCFHCHGQVLFMDNQFHNNGLDAIHTDLGLGTITGDPNDNGKFKTTTLRNIEYTAPYMHDGRFQTLEEVIDFYSEGLQLSATIDPLMKKAHQGGLQLSPTEKQQLLAFLKTLSDPGFLTNSEYQPN